MVLLLPESGNQARVSAGEVSSRSERVRHVDRAFPATVWRSKNKSIRGGRQEEPKERKEKEEADERADL